MTGADDLTVSLGGYTSVRPDTLSETAAVLSALAGDALGFSRRASGTARLTRDSALAEPFGFSEAPLIRAARSFEDASDLAELLAGATSAAAETYRSAEQSNAGIERFAEAITGLLTGALLKNAAITMLPLAVPLVVAGLALQHPELRRATALLGRDLMAAFAEHRELLGDPTVIGLVRGLVSSSDDILMGIAGVPPVMAAIAGESGAGIVGIGAAAGAVMLFGGRHAFTETPVKVSSVSTTSAVPPPISLGEAARRIPAAEKGEPQVRIEEYRAEDGSARYAVYVAGTADFAATPGIEPLDLTSNLASIAGVDAAGVRAVEEAMRLAGVEQGDPVALFGHSQGGLVAARIAESGSFRVESLVTFGAPSGQIDVPAEVAQLAVEHSDDLVPALGGMPRTDASGSDRIVVSRQAYPEGAPADAGALPAHAMSGYERTASLIDGSEDPRLADAVASIAVIGAGTAVGTASTYRAERVR